MTTQNLTKAEELSSILKDDFKMTFEMFYNLVVPELFATNEPKNIDVFYYFRVYMLQVNNVELSLNDIKK